MRFYRLLALLLLATLLMAACGDDDDTPAASGTAPSEDSSSDGVSSGDGAAAADDGGTGTVYPLEIESCGFTSTLEAPPERIVVYYDLVEPLLLWGLGDKIVGWHTYNATSLYPGMNELMAELDITAEPWPRETLTALEPDLVVTASWWSFNTEAGFLSREELAEAGTATYIPASLCAQDRADATEEEVAALSNRGFDDIIAELIALGVIVDKQAESADLVEELTTKMDEVEAAIGDVEPVRTAVLAVDSTGETIWGVYVGGSNEDYITRAGGVNPFRDPAEQFKALSIEELTNVPLDVLLIDSDGPRNATRSPSPSSRPGPLSRMAASETFPASSPAASAPPGPSNDSPNSSTPRAAFRLVMVPPLRMMVVPARSIRLRSRVAGSRLRWRRRRSGSLSTTTWLSLSSYGALATRSSAGTPITRPRSTRV